LKNALAEKLSQGANLTVEDHARLDLLVSRTRQVASHKNIIAEGQVPDEVHLVLEGLACRFKVMKNGRRQILAFLVPGDFCDLHVAILGNMDHGIATLTPCTMVEISTTTVEELTSNHPKIARALWWATLVDEAVLREWLVNIGQRPANQRLAHLLCELLVRLQTVGGASDNSYSLPITQEEMGDALGLSIVHVNRTLQAMRRAGLITLKNTLLVIKDVERLKAFADFDPAYLHLAPNSAPSAIRRQVASISSAIGG